MAIEIESDVDARIELYTANAKKTGKPFTAVRVVVGKWSALVFPTPFELDYLKEHLSDK